MNPLEWTNQPKTVLDLGFLQTTGNQFGATITVTGTNFAPGAITIKEEVRSFGFYNAGSMDIRWSAFPITISAEISCNTDFDTVKAPQQALGLKEVKHAVEPVCYQSTVFCNDNASSSGRDLDYNDFVLIAQLYNSSTD